MAHELYRKSGSGRYDADGSYKRPKKGEKGKKPTPSTGDYKAKKKPKKKPSNPVKGWGGSSY